MLELGPLALFFAAYSKLGIFAATGVLMACVVVSLGVSYAMLRRIPVMPLVTAVIVLIFGSLTLILHDETLIKIKPTALYLLFAAALFIGVWLKKPLLKILFDGALHVTEEGSHGLVGGLLPSDFPPDKAGMLTATAVSIPATFVALIISFALTRRLPLMPVVTTGMVLVFGALTLWLQDKTFIEIKLTIIYCMFVAALLGSMAFGKLLLPIILDAAFHLDVAGWRTLTVRWGLFFFALAALNEILRHALNWDQWVAFKTFAVLPITLVFALAQAPLIMRHETKDDEFSKEI